VFATVSLVVADYRWFGHPPRSPIVVSAPGLPMDSLSARRRDMHSFWRLIKWDSIQIRWGWEWTGFDIRFAVRGDSLVNFLLVLAPAYASSFLLLPMFLGGLSLTVWLLVKGVDVSRMPSQG
jgi:hypothetical protein